MIRSRVAGSRHLQRVSGAEERRIWTVARLGGISSALLLGLYLWFGNAGQFGQAERVAPQVEAEIEAISGSMRGVGVFVFWEGSSPYVLDASVVGIASGQPRVCPFFYRQADAQEFAKRFLVGRSGWTLKQSDLGFIYGQFRRYGQEVDYVLFQHQGQAGAFVSQPFAEIPVYYGKNIRTNAPLYLEQNGVLVAVPYFLSRKGLDQAVASRGSDWQVVERRLLSIVALVPTHEVGRYIQVIPPD